ncbi:hypothetical protein F5888DRAFT_253586 [Russula emetica]|nr:hypothetical protein F5888DRAFT_253586 [Russula emetica]
MMLPAILVTLIQYLLTVPILMCGLTAQSARLSFLFARAQDNSPRRMENGRQKFKVEMPSMPTDLFLHGRKKMLQSNSILCRGNGFQGTVNVPRARSRTWNDVYSKDMPV